MKQRMQNSYEKGLAICLGPEHADLYGLVQSPVDRLGVGRNDDRSAAFAFDDQISFAVADAPAQQTPRNVVLREEVLPDDGSGHLSDGSGGGGGGWRFELVVQTVHADGGRRLPVAGGNEQEYDEPSESQRTIFAGFRQLRGAGAPLGRASCR